MGVQGLSRCDVPETSLKLKFRNFEKLNRTRRFVFCDTSCGTYVKNRSCHILKLFYIVCGLSLAERLVFGLLGSSAILSWLFAL